MLAPTRPLVLQHYETFKRMLKLEDGEVSVMTGETDPAERSYLWRKSRFIFATPQTVRNDLKGGRVELNDTVLLVFDEAHRSVKDYSYTQLATVYKEQGWTPLILGLTASPGGSREKVAEIMKNLFIEKVEARTEEDEDVKSYVEQTKLEGIKVPLPQEYSTLLNALREIYNEKVTRLVEGGFIPKTRLSKKILLQARGTMVVPAPERGGERLRQGIHLRRPDQPGAGHHNHPRDRAPRDAGARGAPEVSREAQRETRAGQVGAGAPQGRALGVHRRGGREAPRRPLSQAREAR